MQNSENYVIEIDIYQGELEKDLISISNREELFCKVKYKDNKYATNNDYYIENKASIIYLFI